MGPPRFHCADLGSLRRTVGRQREPKRRCDGHAPTIHAAHRRAVGTAREMEGREDCPTVSGLGHALERGIEREEEAVTAS